jgi:hypothetical protein
MIETDCFTDLVISLLAVNGWNLEKAGGLLENLRGQGLTNPGVVSGRLYGENATSLETAGYSRGEYMVSLLTDRIIAAAKAWLDCNLEVELRLAEIHRDVQRIAELLNPINGVGRVVVSNYLLLRGLK